MASGVVSQTTVVPEGSPWALMMIPRVFMHMINRPPGKAHTFEGSLFIADWEVKLELGDTALFRQAFASTGDSGRFLVERRGEELGLCVT
mmetsp:Transcript_3852/g.7450  ORF Transcript_3852/g.7450 Transcript_3852/m.7450 type:complete len:90 (-) Transcript_3852:340-609(-)